MDKIQYRGRSRVQYGKHNDRIYLMSLASNEVESMLQWMEEKAKEDKYTKIFAKVPEGVEEQFAEWGYQVEARIPEMNKGKETILFMAKYFEEWRKEEDKESLNQVIEATQKSEIGRESKQLPKGYFFRLLTLEDAQAMAKVYKEVFTTYPFPIHEPKYLEETMADNFIYFGIFNPAKELIGVSSSEMDEAHSNVEMTDFAVLKTYRGQGLAAYLLAEMEAEMRRKGIITAFTIARAKSFGMNKTFAKGGYRYTGTLIKNTNIAGNFESMNVWYKKLR